MLGSYSSVPSSSAELLVKFLSGTIAIMKRFFSQRWIPIAVTFVVFVELAWTLGSALMAEASAGGVSFSCNFAECANLAGAGDRGWYLKAALDLYDQGRVTENFNWVYALWPPGMVGINLGFLKIFGPAASVATFHIVLTSVAFTTMLTTPVWIAVTRWRAMLAGLIAISVPWLTFMVEWPLGVGLLYADGYSAVLVILGVAVLLFSRSGPTRRPIVVVSTAGGVLVGGSAYMRSSSEATVNALTIIVLVAFLLSFIWNMATTLRAQPLETVIPHLKGAARDVVKTRITIVVVGFLIAQALMLPWRVWVHDHVSGSYAFSVTGDQAWIGGWAPDSLYPPDSLHWIFHDNGFCIAYPTRCQAIASKELASVAPYSGNGAYSATEFQKFAIDSVVSDPLPWLKTRGILALDFWGLNKNLPFGNVLSAMVVLVGVLMALAFSVRRLVRRGDASALAVIGGLVAITILVPMVTHFEARYFLPAQLSLVFVAFFVARGGSQRLK